MRDHALLAPSSASRWMTCTPSARLEDKLFAEGTVPITSVYADEGTLAHSLGELLIRFRLDRISKTDFKIKHEKIIKNKLYDREMEDVADTYALFVIEKLNAAIAESGNAGLFTEVKLNLKEYIPESFGHSDAAIVSDNKLTVIDLKYGEGVPVDAYENKQGMIYALGALNHFEAIYDIKEIEIIIYQPRLDSISSYEISAKDLKSWANDVLKPAAALAWKKQGDFIPGDHCRFCKVKHCKALANMNLELANYEFAQADTLADKEIVDILKKAANFKNWLSQIEKYALDQAVNKDKHWPGMKLIEGRSNRSYTSEEEVKKELLIYYDEEQITEKSLLGVTKMTKALGPKVFEAILSDFIIKPKGSPALVPSDDPRPEMNSIENAKEDFDIK